MPMMIGPPNGVGFKVGSGVAVINGALLLVGRWLRLTGGEIAVVETLVDKRIRTVITSTIGATTVMRFLDMVFSERCVKETVTLSVRTPCAV